MSRKNYAIGCRIIQSYRMSPLLIRKKRLFGQGLLLIGWHKFE